MTPNFLGVKWPGSHDTIHGGDMHSNERLLVYCVICSELFYRLYRIDCLGELANSVSPG